MIEAKEAVQRAIDEAGNLFTGLSPNLEEIQREVYQGHDAWSITLSLPRNPNQVLSLAALSKDPTVYKRFLIDAETGQLLAVLIRELELR